MPVYPWILEPAVQSKLYVLNGEGISPKATSLSRWKITHISDILHETGSFIPFMSITETWLKGYITDSQVEIPDFNVYRADRSAIKRGGALLYVHNSLIVSRESFADDGVCQCVLLTIKSLNTVAASIYRPPGTKLSSFKKVIAFIQDYLDNSGNYDVYITGDFNFPNIDWETLNISSELGINGTLSAQALLDLMSGNFLSQVVDKPTRINNILDLLLTNRSQYVANTAL